MPRRAGIDTRRLALARLEAHKQIRLAQIQTRPALVRAWARGVVGVLLLVGVLVGAHTGGVTAAGTIRAILQMLGGK